MDYKIPLTSLDIRQISREIDILERENAWLNTSKVQENIRIIANIESMLYLESLLKINIQHLRLKTIKLVS